MIPSTSGLVTKTQYDSEKQGLEKKKIEDVDKKMPNGSGLVKKCDYIIKITEIENKIPDISQAALVALATAKITDITDQVTKTTINTKAAEIGNKIPVTLSFITTQEFSQITKISFDASMKEAVKNLASKSPVDNGVHNAEKIKKK